MRIQSEVPFGRMLHCWLYLHALNLDQIVRHDRMETGYLAWETVRKQINPYFLNGTGFEGYLVGCCSEPMAALEAILAINQHILDGIFRLHRMQYGLHSRLMKTLTRESSDANAIHIWSVSLGAELGKLRAQILREESAQIFRAETYRIVKMLPPVSYSQDAKCVTQQYTIGGAGENPPNRVYVSTGMLKPDQQDAWLVAKHIGEFGHPLVRKCLDCA